MGEDPDQMLVGRRDVLRLIAFPAVMVAPTPGIDTISAGKPAFPATGYRETERVRRFYPTTMF